MINKEKTMKVLQAGNKKLSRDILIFNLPPGKSCLNCKECYKTCYARKAYRQYPNVKISWNYNLELAKNEPEKLFNSIVNQLKSTKKNIIRIHSSGDFFSQDYIDLWEKIIKSFPDKRFYVYTKVNKLLDFSNIRKLNNFNLIKSFIDGHLNYGSIDYCNKLVKNHGAFLCPATKGKGIRCGQDCNYCINNSRPVFIEH
jgi:hypothetical protein